MHEQYTIWDAKNYQLGIVPAKANVGNISIAKVMWMSVLYIAAALVVTCCCFGCFCCCCRPCRVGKSRSNTTVVRGHLDELVDVDRPTGSVNYDNTYNDYMDIQQSQYNQNKYYEN